MPSSRFAFSAPPFLAAVAAAAVLAVPSLAHAQFDLHDEQTGLEGSIHAGYGGFSHGAAFNNSTSGGGPTTGSFGMQFHLGYRVIPVLSAGFHGLYNVLGVRTGDGADAGAFGIYARVHILSFMPRRTRSYAGTPDLFVGAGFDFFAQTKGWNGSTTVTGSGLAFPFQVGFNYALTDNVEIGVLGMVAPWTQSSGCVRFNASTLCGSTNTDPEAYLYIGLGVSGHFNLLH